MSPTTSTLITNTTSMSSNVPRNGSKQIISNIFRKARGLPIEHSKTFEIVKNGICDVNEKHTSLMSTIISQIDPEDGNCCTTYHLVTDSALSDNVINWGRIIVNFAFIEKLATNCCVNHSCRCTIESLQEYVITYFDQKFGSWIEVQGGWASFGEKYHPEELSDERLKKGLLVISGAALAFFGYLTLKS